MVSWLRATPAMPAMPEPSPKVMASTHWERTPMARAMARFCDTARTCRPSRVLFRIRNRRAKTSRQKRMIYMRFRVRDRTSLTCQEPDIQAGVSTERLRGEKTDRTSCCRIRLIPKVASKVSRGRP